MGIIEPKIITYYDLNDIMIEMEKRGFMTKRDFWRDYVTEHGVSNDTIFWLSFEYYSYTDKSDKYKEYFEGVNKLLGKPLDNNGIMVEISW
jgi:hypothetical protein